MRWLPEALDDLERLHTFLLGVSPEAASRAAAAILLGADRLEASPKVGKPIEGDLREWYVPFGVAAYVLRYRLDSDENPVIVRVWHSREDRE